MICGHCCDTGEIGQDRHGLPVDCPHCEDIPRCAVCGERPVTMTVRWGSEDGFLDDVCSDACREWLDGTVEGLIEEAAA